MSAAASVSLSRASSQSAAPTVPQVRPFRLGVIGKIYHFSYVRRFVRRLGTFLDEHPGDLPERFAQDYRLLADAVAEEGRWLAASDEHQWAEDIAKADHECDQLLRGLRMLVRAHCLDLDPQRAEAARRLRDRIRHDRLSPRDYYDTEAFSLRSWADAVMEDDTLRAAAELLDMTDLIQRLRSAALRLSSLIGQRNEYRSTRPVGAHQAARKATDRHYRWLVHALNACATYRWLSDGDPDRYDELIRTLNEDIHYYQATVLPDRSHKPKADAAADDADTDTADDSAAAD